MKVIRRHLTLIMALFFLAVVLLGTTAYAVQAEQFEDVYLDGTSINGFDVSGKNAADATALLKQQAESYALTINFRDGSSETINGSDFGLTYTDDGAASKLLASQNKYSWIGSVFGKTNEYTVDTEYTYDYDTLAALVMALPELQDEAMVAPTDAQVVYADGTYSVTGETEGNLLDKDAVLRAVTIAVDNESTALDLAAVDGVYAAPAVTTADAASLQSTADQLNQFTTGSVTYQLPDGTTQTLDGNTTRNWLSVDENGNYYKDDAVWAQNISDFVASLAGGIDNVGGDRTFNATGIGPVTVSGGTYGYTVDQVAEIEQLTSELESGAVVTREPIYSTWETSKENGGFGNSYVEADLSRQHLWIYVDGQVVLETDIVSGKMTPEYYTPEGTYLVYAKMTDTVLKGQIDPETNKPTYEAPVDYWMPFNDQIGLHDADWKYVFGGDEYIYNGSKGCINLPVDVAPQVYELVNYDMPIVVYYSQGYELHE